jgi:ABC-type multidrug transport system fused ATPase/permease subunit
MRKLRDAWRTLRLLYDMDRSAFLVSAATSAIQALVYPLILVVIWQAFSLILAQADPSTNLVQHSLLLLGGLFALFAVQALLQTVNETATSILRAESAQQVNGRIMRKMAEVPYRLFEDNAFQSRYGLLISQASYRPGVLVEALVGTISACVATVAIALTMATLAPLLNVLLLVLIPLTIVETRYHTRIIDLQTTSAPELFRMMHLAQKSIDATWQRDLRVHSSTVLEDEYRVLAAGYLHNLKRLLRKYQVVRIAAGLGAAAIMTLAMGVTFWQITRGPSGLAEAAILLPALVMGLNQGRAFSFSWGSLTECLGYLAQVFDFLNQSFEEARHGAQPAPVAVSSRLPAAV